MAAAKIQVDNTQVLEALNRLVQQSGDLSEPLQEIGEYLVESTKQRFATKTAPDGTAWKGNSPVTIDRKGRDDALIGETTQLADAIFPNVSGNTLEIGSTRQYAAMQHFGGRRSDFAHLWGDIPARPFLGLSDDDEDVVLEVLSDYFASEVVDHLAL